MSATAGALPAVFVVTVQIKTATRLIGGRFIYGARAPHMKWYPCIQRKANENITTPKLKQLIEVT